MTAAPSPTGTRRRRWTPGLVVHACLVVVVLLASHGDSTGAPVRSFADGVLFSAHLLLASPWWLIAVFLDTAAPAGSAVSVLLVVVPLVLNVVLHAVVIARRSRRPVEQHRPSAAAGPRWTPSTSAVFGMGAAAGAAVWAAWLGWDDTASYDVVSGRVESPYVSLQVLGCALSVGAVTAVLAHRWSPLTVAAGVSAGFWLLWTADASRDETGLFLVGALLLGLGLVAGTSLAATVGGAVRASSRAAGAQAPQLPPDAS